MSVEIINPSELHDPTGFGYSHVAQLRTFIVDHDLDKLTILGKKIAEIWGERPPVQTLLGVAALALPGMQFEVDAVAVRGRPEGWGW